MKLGIILAVVAFLVSAAASTFVIMKRAPAPVVADSAAVAADSLHPDATARDSTRADPGRHLARDDSARGAGHATPDTGAAPAPVAAPDSTPVKPVTATLAAALPPKPVPPVGPSAAERAGAYKQVARVLSAMKAPEAAQVLQLMSDDEVEGILRSVGPRQAADFLTNIPKTRAAELSRRLLVPKPKEATR